MRLRKQTFGTRNLVGARVTMARKDQGMNPSELSKLEGQHRYVTHRELAMLAAELADVLGVSVDWLLGREGNQCSEAE